MSSFFINTHLCFERETADIHALNAACMETAKILNERVMLNRVCFLLLLFCSLLMPQDSLFAQSELTIGVPAHSGEFNLFRTKNATALILENFVLGRLLKVHTRAGGDLKYSFDLASGLEVEREKSEIEIFVPANRRFQNGSFLQDHDLLHSLSRCQDTGLLSNKWSIQSREELPDRIQLLFRLKSSVDVGLSKQDFEADILLAELGTCPILEESSSRVFGEFLGEGSNFVSTGAFRLIDFRSGHHYRLERLPSNDSTNRLPEIIELRIISDPAQALAALRIGNIQLFFTENQEVTERAKKDETLFISKCSIYSVVLRRGLHFSCAPDHSIDLSF